MSNAKAKKGKGKTIVSGSAAPPGFSFEPDGSLSVIMNSVPRSPLGILATGFRIIRENNEILFLFGNSSRFDTDKNGAFIVAIEISMALISVYKSLIDSVWIQPSSNHDQPMIESVKRGLSEEEVEEAAHYECTKGLPPIETRGSTYRAYQADFTSSYVWGAHGGLEFLTLPSSLYTIWRKTGIIREGDQTTSILTVVMPRHLIYAFFLQVREVCKEYNPDSDPSVG